MGENSKIEWTHHTFNPWRGCVKVSPGCTNCYAEKQAKRNPGLLGIWGKDGRRVIASESMWKEPVRWNREAQSAGERRRVFCASMADIAEILPQDHQDELPLEAARLRLMDLIDATPWLDWLLLTKRPENVPILFPSWNKHGWPRNVWMGTSVEDQLRADERIPLLLQCPAAVRFLSVEPLLGPVDIEPWLWPQNAQMIACGSGGAIPPEDLVELRSYARFVALRAGRRFVDWVIVGGESGPRARPMHSDWARSIRNQCQAAGVAFHFKQWGEWGFGGGRSTHAVDLSGSVRCIPFSESLLSTELPIARLGKHAAGRILDGRTWDELPALVPA